MVSDLTIKLFRVLKKSLKTPDLEICLSEVVLTMNFLHYFILQTEVRFIWVQYGIFFRISLYWFSVLTVESYEFDI